MDFDNSNNFETRIKVFSNDIQNIRLQIDKAQLEIQTGTDKYKPSSSISSPKKNTTESPTNSKYNTGIPTEHTALITNENIETLKEDRMLTESRDENVNYNKNKQNIPNVPLDESLKFKKSIHNEDFLNSIIIEKNNEIKKLKRENDELNDTILNLVNI